MPNQMLEQLLNFPIIAAVKNDEGLENALQSPCAVVFTLYGDICSIGEITRKIRAAKKLAIVHADLIDGLAGREVSIRFLKEHTASDGIISTKSQLIHTAGEMGLITVQRFFLLDSLSLENLHRHVAADDADFIEILPGIMPKIIKQCVGKIQIPVISGGLISDKEDIVSALGAGATAVSTTRQELWFE